MTSEQFAQFLQAISDSTDRLCDSIEENTRIVSSQLENIADAMLVVGGVEREAR